MAAYDNTREELRQLRRQVDDLMDSRVTPLISRCCEPRHGCGSAGPRLHERPGRRPWPTVSVISRSSQLL